MITLVEPIVLYEKTLQISKSGFLSWVKILRHFTAWDEVPQTKSISFLSPVDTRKPIDTLTQVM